MKAGIEKETLNLSLNKSLKRVFKAYCAMIGRDMNEVTEELYRDFLEGRGVRIPGDSEQATLLEIQPSRYSPVSEQGVIAHVETDAEGHVTKIDEPFTQMCGYSLKELRGKKPGGVLQGPATEPEIVQAFRKAIRDQQSFECTLTNYHKDGTIYRVHIKMEPIFKGRKLTGFRARERKVSDK